MEVRVNWTSVQEHEATVEVNLGEGMSLDGLKDDDHFKRLIGQQESVTTHRRTQMRTINSINDTVEPPEETVL